MKTICQITLPGNLDIDFMFDKGKIAYTFTHKDKTYGNAVKVSSRKIQDIAATCMVLFTNAIETKKKLDESI